MCLCLCLLFFYVEIFIFIACSWSSFKITDFEKSILFYCIHLMLSLTDYFTVFSCLILGAMFWQHPPHHHAQFLLHHLLQMKFYFRCRSLNLLQIVLSVIVIHIFICSLIWVQKIFFFCYLRYLIGKICQFVKCNARRNEWSLNWEATVVNLNLRNVLLHTPPLYTYICTIHIWYENYFCVCVYLRIIIIILPKSRFFYK